MVGITLTPEQIRVAPPEVRQWLESQLRAAFEPEPLPPEPRFVEAQPIRSSDGLADCSLQEVTAIFAALKNNFHCCQVFFELGREDGRRYAAHPDICVISVADIAKRTRIQDGQQLATCFNDLNEASKSVLRGAASALFAFDQMGNCLIKASTHDHIRDLWRSFVEQQYPATRTETVVPPFTLPAASAAPPYRTGAPKISYL